MSVTGIGPVADGGTYGKWLGDISGTSGIGPFSSGETYAQAIGGGAGTSGLQNFLNNLGGGALNLSNLNRLAGTIGSFLGPGFDAKAVTKALDKRTKQATRKTDVRIENIYPELTGMTGEEALNKYYDNFSDVIQKTQALGRSDLGIDPELASQYDRLGSRVQNIQNQYSLGGRLGGYERLALDPPVVSMDVGSVRGAADWSAPEIARQYSAFTDYSGPQASRFIYGGKNTAEDIGSYYGNSSDIAKMMDYKTLDAVGRYYNTSGDVAGLMNYGTMA